MLLWFLLLRCGRRRWLWTLIYFPNGNLAAEALVIGISDEHANMNGISLGEDQVVVRGCICRKPVAPVNLFAIGFEERKALVAFRYSLSAHFNDLQVARVHPNPTLKVPVFGLLRIGHDL